MPRLPLLLACLLFALGCQSARSFNATVVSTPPPATIAPVAATPITAPPAPISAPAAVPTIAASPAAANSPAASPTACGYGPVRKLADLQDRTVNEASALVASRRWPGVYWTLNDSGNAPLLFAFDQNGRNLGSFRVDGADNTDWESLQLGPGKNGEPALYVGDTGDNNKSRRESVIYRVPEPAVSLNPKKPLVGKTAPAESFRFDFPGGSRDVEAMLIDPTNGEIVLITKEFLGKARVFRLLTPLGNGGRATLEAAADLDLNFLGPLGSAVTDAAVSPDGRRVVVRTYTAAVEYDLPERTSLPKLGTLTGRSYPLADGPQGEGITYRADGKALLTIGESTPAVLYQSEWRC